MHRAALAIVVVGVLGACAGPPYAPGEPTPTAVATDDTAAASEHDSADAVEEATEEPDGAVTITGTDDATWATPDVTAPAGLIEITLQCGPEVSHSLRIDGVNDDRPVAGCLGGGASTKLVTVDPGTYPFTCTIPGHNDMVGTLTVG